MVRTGERFGTEHLTNVLLGENSEAVQKFGHDRLPTFGVGKEYDKQAVALDLPPVVRCRHHRLDITGYGSWKVTEAGRRVLKGAEKITLRTDTLKTGRKAARAAANTAALADGGPGDTALFEALRKRRSELAKAQGVAAYVVFADKTLIDMARKKPKNGGRHGFGARCRRSEAGAIRCAVPRRHPATCGRRALDLRVRHQPAQFCAAWSSVGK